MPSLGARRSGGEGSREGNFIRWQSRCLGLQGCAARVSGRVCIIAWTAASTSKMLMNVNQSLIMNVNQSLIARRGRHVTRRYTSNAAFAIAESQIQLLPAHTAGAHTPRILTRHGTHAACMHCTLSSTHPSSLCRRCFATSHLRACPALDRHKYLGSISSHRAVMPGQTLRRCDVAWRSPAGDWVRACGQNSRGGRRGGGEEGGDGGLCVSAGTSGALARL